MLRKNLYLCGFLPDNYNATLINRVPRYADAYRGFFFYKALFLAFKSAAFLLHLCNRVPRYADAYRGFFFYKALFLAFNIMKCYIQNAPENEPVFQFIDKKRAEGKPYYVYMTAPANKFLRRYYAKVNEYLSSSENTFSE